MACLYSRTVVLKLSIQSILYFQPRQRGGCGSDAPLSWLLRRHWLTVVDMWTLAYSTAATAACIAPGATIPHGRQTFATSPNCNKGVSSHSIARSMLPCGIVLLQALRLSAKIIGLQPRRQAYSQEDGLTAEHDRRTTVNAPLLFCASSHGTSVCQCDVSDVWQMLSQFMVTCASQSTQPVCVGAGVHFLIAQSPTCEVTCDPLAIMHVMILLVTRSPSIKGLGAFEQANHPAYYSQSYILLHLHAVKSKIASASRCGCEHLLARRSETKRFPLRRRTARYKQVHRIDWRGCSDPSIPVFKAGDVITLVSTWSRRAPLV